MSAAMDETALADLVKIALRSTCLEGHRECPPFAELRDRVGDDDAVHAECTADVMIDAVVKFQGTDQILHAVRNRETELGAAIAAAIDAAPIPMLLWCPVCGDRHIDAGTFATKPHHTHACQSCGMVWRPAIKPTVGVAFLPGFKDADIASE